jgi:hypothetical protein
VTVVNALSYGATGDGTTDDTAALLAAIATGHSVALPKGRYKVTDLLALSTGQDMFGEGRTDSVFVIEDDFNMSALGVVRVASSEPGGGLRNLGFEFDQDNDNTVRASVIAYPPAIYAVAVPRFEVREVRISGAYKGIVATGNSGGAFLRDIECGAIHTGLHIDGALSFMHIEAWHSWIFGWTGAAYEGIWSDGETVAVRLGRVDGIDAGSIAAFRSKVVIDGATFGLISRLELDDKYARLEMSNGNLMVGSMYSTSSAADDYAVTLTGGYLAVGSFYSTCINIAAATSQFKVTGGSAVFSGGIARSFQPDQRVFEVTGGDLTVSGVAFPATNTTRTVPMIEQSGGRITVVGCSAPTGGGTGDFIKIATDGGHIVSGNNANGWTVDLPATNANGNYDDPPIETFTPTLGFATAGDLSVAYDIQTGRLIREGGALWYYIDIQGTVTYTTASGAVRIAGLPLALTAIADVPAATWENINLASGFTHVAAEFTVGTHLNLVQSGDNVANVFVTTVHIPSGTQVRVRISARVLA